MNKSRIPSPARSQGPPVTPRRYKPRVTRSVGSPARTTPGRLSSVVDKFKEQNRESIQLSPLQKTVLNDVTDIEQPRRASWWKKVDTSRDVLEVLDSNKIPEDNNLLEEVDMEVISQENKEDTLDLPESSDCESIHSIVVPQRRFFQKENKPENKVNQEPARKEILEKQFENTLDLPESSGSESIGSIVMPKHQKLFAQKDNKVQSKFKQIISRRQNLNKNDKTSVSSKSEGETRNIDKDITLAQDKTLVDKTKDVTVHAPPRSLFGNRNQPKNKTDKFKNMFAAFVVSDSEDEISDVQPTLFAFQKNANPVRHSTKGVRDSSPRSSITTDMELDDWKLLPSSTMVDQQIESETPPIKKARLSKLSEAKESGISTNTESTVNKTKQSNKSNLDNAKDIPSKTFTITKDAKVPEKDGEMPEKEPEDRNINSTKNNVSKMETETDNGNTKNLTRVLHKTSEFTDQNEPMVIDQEKENHKMPAQSTDNLIEHKGMKTRVQKEITIEKPNEKDNTLEKIQNNIESDDEELNLTYDDNNGNEEVTEKQGNEEVTEKQEIKTIESKSQKTDENIRDDKAQMSKMKMMTEINKTQKEHDNITEKDNLNVSVDHIEKELTKMFETDAKEPSKEPTSNKQTDDHIEIQNKKIIEETVNNKQEMEVQNIVQTEQYQGNVNNVVIENQEKDNSNKQILKMLEQDIEQVANEEDKCNKTVIEQNLSQQDPNEQKNVTIEDKEPFNGSVLVSENETLNNDTESEEDENILQENSIQEQEIEAEDRNDASNVQESENENDDDIEQHSENEEQIEENENEEQIEESENEEQIEESENEEQLEEIENEEYVEENDNEEDIEEEIEYEEYLEESEIEEQVLESDNEEAAQENQEEEITQENENHQQEHDEVEDNEDQVDTGEIVRAEKNTEERVQNEESPNATHDTTGRHRNKNDIVSPEVPNHADPFVGESRNTSLRKTTLLKKLSMRPSMAPTRDSIGLSDGTKNSSVEGSGWDSHRTTRKTLRQTFGKDFSPRKSLRALVMEKSANRKTVINEANAELRNPQANSTELARDDEIMDGGDNFEMMEESNHDVSVRTRQTNLEMYWQNIVKHNNELTQKIQQQVRESLKVNTYRQDFLNFAPQKSVFRKPTKNTINPQKKRAKPAIMIPLEDLPDELVEDMKYKPPKRFKPRNASWITKRLYKYLETKLEPKYNYKARMRAEKLVETLYNFVKEHKKDRVASTQAIEVLKKEFARLNIVKTHYEFYNFIRDYMPKEVKWKIIPDLVNGIPVPRNVFADILSEE